MAHAHTYTHARTHPLSHARINSGFEKGDKNILINPVFFVCINMTEMEKQRGKDTN